MAVKVYDTYKKDLVEIKPISQGQISLYTCGPTVYSNAHIGNMRYFIFQDILARVLAGQGYVVKHVMNVTDVGHLTSDEDEGEDKMEKGAQQQKKTVWEVAEHYTNLFELDAAKLNIQLPTPLRPATAHISEIVELVQTLLDKGFAYETAEAIYFDIAKFPAYEKLTGQKLEDKIKGARREVITENSKKHPADFAVWFKTVGRFANHTMRWTSPWGEGFPGWHIECSAISRKYLGQPFDIHTGGIDHVTVHHPNEIAQSESAFGTALANYWLHSEHLSVEGQKMSKSLGNLYTLADLEDKGFEPLGFRYLVLTSHYQNKLNFTWESLKSAATAYSNLKQQVKALPEAGQPDQGYLDQANQYFSNNLDTASAIALIWQILKDRALDSGSKRATLNELDKVLGLSLSGLQRQPIPDKIQAIVRDRDQARNDKNWPKSDELRSRLEQLGYIVEDTPTGTKIEAK